MVSERFAGNLYASVHKQLGPFLDGEVSWRTGGSAQDQYKGLANDIKKAVIPFSSTTYTAEEWVVMRIPLKGDLVRYLDFAAPMLNIKGQTIQGVGTFVTHVPVTCKETYVERSVGLKVQLVPHSLVVRQRREPKEVVKGGLIRSAAVNAVNADKKTWRCLGGNRVCNVKSGLGSKHYTVEFDSFHHPLGMFSAIPYYGNTIMVGRDAGSSSARADHPQYDFKEMLLGFLGVAKALKAHPESGEEEGSLTMDTALNLLLPPLLVELKSGPRYSSW